MKRVFSAAFIVLIVAFNLFSCGFVTGILPALFNIVHANASMLVVLLFSLALPFIVVWFVADIGEYEQLAKPAHIMLGVASFCTILTGIFVQVREPRPISVPESYPEMMARNAGWPLPFVLDNAGSPLRDIGTISIYDWYNRPQPGAYLVNLLFFLLITLCVFLLFKLGSMVLRRNDT